VAIQNVYFSIPFDGNKQGTVEAGHMKVRKKIIVNLHIFYGSFFHVFTILDDARLRGCKLFHRFNIMGNYAHK
jgi:hypothetical protein